MKKDWKYEIARDSMAFGSILFYIMIIARSTIGSYSVFVYQLLIALVVLIISSFFLKKANHYIARAFVIVFFTSLFYKDAIFTIFAALLWTFMIIAAFYLKENKKSVLKGIILGISVTLISYYVSLVVV